MKASKHSRNGTSRVDRIEENFSFCHSFSFYGNMYFKHSYSYLKYLYNKVLKLIQKVSIAKKVCVCVKERDTLYEYYFYLSFLFLFLKY